MIGQWTNVLEESNCENNVKRRLAWAWNSASKQGQRFDIYQILYHDQELRGNDFISLKTLIEEFQISIPVPPRPVILNTSYVRIFYLIS